MKFNLLLAFIFLGISLQAQKLPEPINSREIAEKALEYYQDDKYEEALAEYQKIDRNDSLYTDVMVEITRTLLGLERYDSVAAICREGIAMHNENEVYFRNNLGLSYLRAKKYEQCIAVLDSAIKVYPNNYLLYLNKANAFKESAKYDSALVNYKQAILCNPYASNAHLGIGLMAADEGKISQAMMSFNMFLLLEPASKRSLSLLSSLNEMVSSKYKREPKNINLSPEGGDDFSDLDLVISNYTALNKDFKTPAKMELAIVKQNYALFQNLKYDKNDKGFWMQTYVRFFKGIYDQQKFVPYTYYILQSTTNPEYVSLINKNKDAVNRFASEAGNEVDKIQQTRHVVFNGKEGDYTFLYNNKNHSVIVIGTLDPTGKKLEGYCESYHPEGNLSAKGMYKNGEKEGPWVYYHKNGQLSSEETNKAGVSEGPYKVYYDNGVVRREGVYKNDKENGDLKEYNRAGLLTSVTQYRDNITDGPVTLYYDMGKDFRHYTGNYKGGIITDSLIEYYPNGARLSECKMANNEISGLKRTYHMNGKLQSETNLVAGVKEGQFRSWYSDGKPEKEGLYKAGTQVGLWKSYYRQGGLEDETNFDEKGKMTGNYKEYDYKGKMVCEMEYLKGDIVAYKYYSSDGKILSEGKRIKGDLKFAGFYPSGVKRFEGVYTSKGKTGIWKFYNEYGFLVSKESFNEDAEMDGALIRYFQNGQIEDSISYKEDEKQGYGVSYFIEGKKEIEGYYIDNKKAGYWYEYYRNGILKSNNYYVDGELSGWQKYFAVNGKLEKEEYYKNQLLDKIIFYDSTGAVTQTCVFPKEHTGDVVLQHTNGKIKSKSTYIMGNLNGPLVWNDINGKVTVEGGYLNGDRHGQWKWYYENGQVDTEGKYEGGKKQGVWNSYHENGKLKDTFTYFDNDVIGEAKWSYDNGQVETKKNYIADEEEGEGYYYDPFGEVQMVRNYSNGKIMSYSYMDKDNKLVPARSTQSGTYKCETFYPNGQKSLDYEIKNGLFEGPRLEYTSQGKLYSSQPYKFDLLHGLSKQYYPDGKIRSEENYSYGEKNGVCKYYYPDGKVEKEITYLMDEKHGVAKYYDKTGKLVKTQTWYSDNILKEQKI